MIGYEKDLVHESRFLARVSQTLCEFVGFIEFVEFVELIEMDGDSLR